MSAVVGDALTSKTGSHATATRRTLAISLAGIILWLAWVLIGLLTALPTADTGRDFIGRAGTIGCLFASSLVLALLGVRAWLVGVQLAVLVVVTPLVEATTYADSTAGTLLIVLGLTAGVGGRAGAATAVVLFGAAGHTVMSRVYGEALVLNLQDVVLATVLAFAGAAFMGALTTAATALDRAEAANAHQESVLLLRAAELAATTSHQRVLHDDVLGILNLIGEGAGQPERLRSQADAALTEIRRVMGTTAGTTEPGVNLPLRAVRPPESLRQLLDLVSAAAPVEVHVHAPRRLSVDFTDTQAAAVERALSEAIRNSARHAGVTEVGIEVRQDPAGVTLTVFDRGAGIEDGAQEGYGTQHSIRRPVEEIGGTVDITSSRGGTRVVLRVPMLGRSGVLGDAHDLTLAVARPVSWPLTLVGPALGVVWFALALRLAWPDPALVTVACGWLAVTVVTMVRLGRGPLTWRWVVGLTATVLSVQVIAATVLPPGSLLDWRSWTYGFSSVPLVLMAFVVPWRASLPVILGNASIPLLAAAVSPGLSEGVIPLGAVSGAATSPLAAALVGFLLRRQGRRLREQQARRRALDYDREVQRVRESCARRYFRQVEQQVVPWLAGVANGVTQAPDPETSRVARLLAMTVRDDLHAPGALDEHVQAAVADHRLRGGLVELRAGLDAVGADPDAQRVLGGLLKVAGEGSRIIVALQDGTPAHGLRISMVPPPDPVKLRGVAEDEKDRLDINADPFRAVVLLDLSDASRVTRDSRSVSTS